MIASLCPLPLSLPCPSLWLCRQQDRKRGAKPNNDNFVPVSAYRVVVPLAPQLLRLEPVDKVSHR